MADTPLLSDLCTVCHSPPKYRCPRCSARTCSLPCSKRHKQWAQCNGIRDPAVYLRRSELATPQAFDRDFNFISGIERTIESAERDATLRGVLLHDARTTARRDGPVKGEVQLQRALQNCGVVVEKAPVGMSRSLHNKTGWNKNQHCIAWTIEWVLDDGTVKLGTSLEKDSIAEAFRKQFDIPTPRNKKRKIAKASQGLTNSTSTPATAFKTISGNPPISVVDTLAGSLPADADSKVTDPSVHSYVEQSDPLPVQSEKQFLITDRHVDPAVERCSEPATNPGYFYLHITRPLRPSPKPTLLPVSPSSVLTSILRDRIIREFPTIYVLSNKLPDSTDAKFAFQADPTEQVSDMTKSVLNSDQGVADGTPIVIEEKENLEDRTSIPALDHVEGLEDTSKAPQQEQCPVEDLAYIQETII